MRLRSLYCPRSVAAQDIPPPALLRESGLLLDRKQGKWVHYRLSPHIPSWAAKIIEQARRCEQEKVQVIVRNLARQNCSEDSKNICS